MHVCQDGGNFEQKKKHRTDINETQYSDDGDATLCIAAANTTLNFIFLQGKSEADVEITGNAIFDFLIIDAGGIVNFVNIYFYHR